MSTGDCLLRLEQRDDGWVLAGPEAERFGLVNEYLSYLADRNYSPKTLRCYGFDLLAFCRWLHAEQVDLAAVTTDVAAAVPGGLPAGQGARPPGPERRVPGRAAARPVRGGHGQPPADRGLGDVRVPGHARPGRAEPGAEGPGGPPAVVRASATACWRTPPGARRPGRRCGCGNRGGCPGRWTSGRPRSCWPASGPGGTGRSPG